MSQVRRFHVSENGPNPCTAETQEACPLKHKMAEHFDTFEEADEFFQIKMEEEYGSTVGIAKADPYSAHSRYGSSGEVVPLDMIEPNSLAVEEIEEGIVLHQLGFAEDSDTAEQRMLADEFGLNLDDRLSMFRVYSLHEELPIGAVIRRQHGIQIADNRYYDPASMEFVIRTGQDLTSLESAAPNELVAFETKLRDEGIDHLDTEMDRPEETTDKVDDQVRVGDYFKQWFSTREKHSITIHDGSYVTQEFRELTDAEKERHGYSRVNEMRVFADFRSDEDNMSAAMGLIIDGKKHFETDPNGEPVVQHFEMKNNHDLLGAYIKSVQDTQQMQFHLNLHQIGARNFMPEWKFNDLFDYPPPEDDTLDPETYLRM